MDLKKLWRNPQDIRASNRLPGARSKAGPFACSPRAAQCEHKMSKPLGTLARTRPSEVALHSVTQAISSSKVSRASVKVTIELLLDWSPFCSEVYVIKGYTERTELAEKGMQHIWACQLHAGHKHKNARTRPHSHAVNSKLYIVTWVFQIVISSLQGTRQVKLTVPFDGPSHTVKHAESSRVMVIIRSVSKRHAVCLSVVRGQETNLHVHASPHSQAIE